ncbi:uncharacterized protein LOC120251182 isoform X2 [Dioscorea cayenensis subsp. rotundata]|uniref:Uncharacterized protein LOC120251182 isoform X2 n=1 Tax=Dioscorea cayennensis subsp. rotundata TaxID=55577 RepID=A0AB40ALP7_DIOCR|nr:uncharacterized protein LOC120251182 isoform X2 [Dioscorea cayenensis subsp. rotundata]
MILFHHAGARTACYPSPINPSFSCQRRAPAISYRLIVRSSSSSPSNPMSEMLEASSILKEGKKPAVCTADELHYVAVPGTEWRLALWRYLPSPKAPVRSHPLMLLSGVGTNAIGYDLSPGASFSRHMCSQGFDTWIVEVRGAGLSIRDSGPKSQPPSKALISEFVTVIDGNANGVPLLEKQSVVMTDSGSESEISVVSRDSKGELALDEPQLVTKLTDAFLRLAETLSGYLNDGQLMVVSSKFLDRISELLGDARLSDRFNEIKGSISGLLKTRETSAIAAQIRELSQRLVNIIDDGQRSVSPQLFDLQERLSATIEDFQKQLDLIVTYNWDFDNYLEEDIPAAMEYIKLESKPKDGRVLAIGHSMGGILLYAMISRCAFRGMKSGLAAMVTLASSVDYTSSKSSLKLLLPLADPAQALNVPVVPLGALLAAAYPLASRPPYVLSWLNPQISAQDMMHPELLRKLVLNNFCTIPAKLLLQLTTAFREGGLRDRTCTFSYKDQLHKCNIPVLALAGDQDLICPPEAVYDTIKLIPEFLVTYKAFGKPDGPHYGHYDLVGGRLAIDEIYPCIIEFLSQHDQLCSD